MRLTAVGLVLLASVGAGCATATAPGSAARAPEGGPASPGAREGQARAQLELGRAAIALGDMAAATVFLREALRLHPELVEARERLGLALYHMGDLDGAVQELRALRHQAGGARLARLTLASVLIARRDWSAARAELDDILREQPESVQAHYSLGLVRYALGDLTGAIESYRQVLARNGDHADARYNLALTLKLAHRDAEATPEFLTTAEAGHAFAQYFLGAAYAGGVGVDRDLALAVGWWARAADQGVEQAAAALGDLRQTALGRSRRSPSEREAARQAFADYRASLWRDFPELPHHADDATVGGALLRQGRGREAVPVLIREATALSEPAQGLLETIYYQGVKDEVAAHDGRILEYVRVAAGEGQLRPRIALARFYAAGLGVPKDVARAIALLKATPHEDARRLLQELSAASEAVPAPTRP